MIAFLQKWALYIVGGYAALMTVIAGVQTWRLHSAEVTVANDIANQKAQDAADSKAVADQKDKKATAQTDLQTSANEIAAAYERGKQDGQAYQGNILSDLASGALSMQPRWQCPASKIVTRVPVPSGSSSEPGQAEREREESSARIVSAAHDCDDQVEKLRASYHKAQDLIKKYNDAQKLQ